MKKSAECVDEKQPTSDEAAASLSSSASFPRPQPKENLSATAKIPKADLDTLLRRESGTRPAMSREEIARHIEEKLAGNEAPTKPPPEDPQLRPTIDVFPSLGTAPAPLPPPAVIVEAPPASASLHTPPPMVLTPARGIILPTLPTPLPAPRASSPRWVILAIVAGAALFVSLTIALGFLLGRLSGH